MGVAVSLGYEEGRVRVGLPRLPGRACACRSPSGSGVGPGGGEPASEQRPRTAGTSGGGCMETGRGSETPPWAAGTRWDYSSHQPLREGNPVGPETEVGWAWLGQDSRAGETR